MRLVALVATVMLAGLAPGASLAQVRTVADEQRSPASAPSVASVVAEWEEAIAQRVTDAERWSTIGQRLYSVGRYRESISAFEQSFVRRNGKSPDDARCIAEAYGKLGNVKQASRWRAAAGAGTEAVAPSGHARTTV